MYVYVHMFFMNIPVHECANEISEMRMEKHFSAGEEPEELPAVIANEISPQISINFRTP